MDPAKLFRNLPGLVALEGSYEMPDNVFKVPQSRLLRKRLLEIILAEMILAIANGLSYGLRGLRFTHRDQGHRASRPLSSIKGKVAFWKGVEVKPKA